MNKKIIKYFSVLLIGLVFLVPVNSLGQGCMEASSDEGVSVVGFLQPQYEYKFAGDESENSFTFNRARIGVVGNIPYDFSYYAVIDFSKFKPDATYILDAFISYTRFSFAKVSLGQFKAPISLELNTSCAGLHTIKRSKVVNELAAPDRDIGVMLFGGTKSGLLNYNLALMNDYKRNVKDENPAKSIKGRVVLSPFEFLKIGGSFSYGKTGAKEDNDKTRLGGDLQIILNNFLLQAEYLYGEDTGDYTTGGGCDGSPIEFHTGGVKRSGFFAQAMYMTPWNLQPVVKFENYDSDLSIDSNSEFTTTVGINYFFNDWTRLQLNYRYSVEEAKEIDNDMFMLQLQVKF